jgi:integrase
MSISIFGGAYPSELITTAFNELRNVDDSYTIDRVQMFRYFDEHEIAEPSFSDFLDYADYLINHRSSDGYKYAASTINQRIAMISTTLKLARQMIRQEFIMQGVQTGDSWHILSDRFDKTNQSLMKKRFKINELSAEAANLMVLSPDQIQHIVSLCEPETALIIRILFTTGVQIGELLSLSWNSVEVIEEDKVFLTVAKHRAPRRVILPSELYSDLILTFPQLDDYDSVFFDTASLKVHTHGSLRQRMLTALRKSDRTLPEITFQTFRNSFAYYLLTVMQVEITQVSNYMGIQNCNVLKKYQAAKPLKSNIHVVDLPAIF